MPASQENELYHQLKVIGLRNIQRQALQFVKHLGSGQFGTVEQAVWNWEKFQVSVALKSLNSKSVCEIDVIKFLQEAVLMAQFRHPNIISLYGVVSVGEPVSPTLSLARGLGRQVAIFL